MANDNFINLITKLTEAFSAMPKTKQKSGNKPENGTFFKPLCGGDFQKSGQNVISPKQSAVEMLRRHDEISKKIDQSVKDGKSTQV